MKKITSILTALSLICTLTACSKGGGSESAQSFTAEKLSDVAYKQEKLPLPENASILYGAVPFDSGNKVYMLGAAEVSPAFWIADRDLGKFERRDLPDFDIGIIYNFGVSNDGEFAVITVHADYGDLPAPDPSSPDYDEARYDAAAEYSLRLMVYGADDKLKSDVTVEDYREQVGKQTMLGDSAFDGKHMVVNIGGGFEVFSAEGKYLSELTAGEGETISDVSVDSTGRLVCAVEVENGTVDIRGVNAAECSLEGGDRYVLGESVQQLLSGTSDYPLFIRTRSTIYGVGSDGALTALMDVNATNVNVNNIIGFSLGTDGNIIVCTTDYTKWQSKLIRFTECDPAELGDVTKLRIGVDSEHSLEQEVSYFTDEYPNIQVERVVYENTGDDPLAPQFTQFDEDVLSGNLPDILNVQRDGTFCRVNVAEKGALIDLMPYMEKDENVKPEDIFPNVLETISTDGKVYALPYRFCADMGYICKKKWADKLIHGDFNFNTYMDAVENRPEGMNFDYYHESDTWWDRTGVADMTWWIDADNYTCNFDSDSFIRYLRYCAGGKDPDTVDLTDLYEDPLNPTEAEIQRGFIMQQMQYRNDKTLFDRLSLGNFDNYMDEIKGSFGGEEITYLGNPRMDGAHTYVDLRLNTFGITKDSKQPDVAWQFISFIESYDFEGNGWSLAGFPITEKRFYELADRNRFDGVKQFPEQEGDGYAWNNGEKTIGLGPLTDEDIEFIHDCLTNAEVPPKSLNIYDNDYYNIIDEERQALFAGESTPEQCAKYLQNRIGIYLSERS